MSGKLVLALPSKGRLMEQCNAALAKAGLAVASAGAARGYKGEIDGLPDVEVELRLLLRDRAAPQDRQRAPRHHRRGPDPRDHGRCRRSASTS